MPEPYDRAWLRVGLALDRTNFTVDDRDRGRGIYFVRYVDPKDMTSAEQGFWSQVFHGKKEKLAKNYEINVRALTETQTRVRSSTPRARSILAASAPDHGLARRPVALKRIAGTFGRVIQEAWMSPNNCA